MLHLFFLSLFIGIRSWEKSQAPQKLKTITQAVRVDLVAMPTMSLQELKNLPNLSRVNKEMSSGPSTRGSSDFRSFIKKQAGRKAIAIKGKKNKKKKDQSSGGKGKGGKDSDLLDRLILEGNKLSKGLLKTGQLSEQELTAVEAYALDVTAQVKPFWQLPKRLIELNLRARVRLFLNNKGEIINLTVHESSGNTEYDQMALRSIRSAAPFSVPQNEILEALRNGLIMLGFPI